MSLSDKYLIKGGLEGLERLRLISRVMLPTTLAFLETTRFTHMNNTRN